MKQKIVKLKVETFDGYMTKIDNLKRELAVVTAQRANTIKQSQENSAYYKGEVAALKGIVEGGCMDLAVEVSKGIKYQAVIGFLSVVCLVSISINLM